MFQIMYIICNELPYNLPYKLPYEILVSGILNVNKKLVALGSDGASVNSGDKGGVCKIMSDDMPWLLFMWCLAHITFEVELYFFHNSVNFHNLTDCL